MRYELRVISPDDIESRFEIERVEPLAVRDVIDQGSMAYKTTCILAGSGEFDAVVVAEWLTGPGQFVSETSPK